MDYLTTEEARWVAQRRKVISVFIPKSGAICIYCGEKNGTYTGGKVLKNGKLIHYHVCQNCGNRFISEELSK